MADSEKLNENVGNVVANTPYEENVNLPKEDEKVAKNDSNVENSGEENKGEVKDTEPKTDAATKEESKPSEEKAKVLPLDPKDDEMKLYYLNKDFVYDCMSVPTHSKKEFRMVTFIILWARKNGVKYEFDDFGNVYLTKGELAEGEFYPCVTSHLDTVQDKQDPYI